MVLDFAGDDITEFLHTLLIRTNFPYRDADLTRWHDFTLLEELKERMVVLSEVRPVTSLPLLTLAHLASFAGRRRAQHLRLLRPHPA